MLTAVTGISGPAIMGDVTDQVWERVHRIGFGTLLGLCAVAACFLIFHLFGITLSAVAAVPLGLGLGSAGTLLVNRFIRTRPGSRR